MYDRISGLILDYTLDREQNKFLGIIVFNVDSYHFVIFTKVVINCVIWIDSIIIRLVEIQAETCIFIQEAGNRNNPSLTQLMDEKGHNLHGHMQVFGKLGNNALILVYQ